jgi:hypothetical protein
VAAEARDPAGFEIDALYATGRRAGAYGGDLFIPQRGYALQPSVARRRRATLGYRAEITPVYPNGVATSPRCAGATPLGLMTRAIVTDVKKTAGEVFFPFQGRRLARSPGGSV